jgi:hypothetical protein
MAQAQGWTGPQAENAEREVAKVISQAWADPEFKTRLLDEPAAVFAEHGLEAPGGVELRAVANTPRVVYLTLPAQPSEELSDEALEGVAGGACAGSVGTAATLGSASTCLGTVSTLGSAGSAGG